MSNWVQNDSLVLLGEVENVVVLVWRGTPTVEKALQVDRNFDRLSIKNNRMMMTVIESDVGLVGKDVRDVLEKAMNARRSAFGGVAILIRGTGFGVAAIRALVSSFYLLIRPPYPVKVFGDLETACAWLQGNWTSELPAPGTTRLKREIEPMLALQ